MNANDEIIKALEILFEPGDVFEIRILGAERDGYRHPHVESGYFDYERRTKVPQALATLNSAAGVYVTINPIDSTLLRRSPCRLEAGRRGLSAGNKDVLHRRWLFIDIDPVRPAGISATEAEKALALERAIELRSRLASAGWPVPVLVDSGNGCYLLYRVDLPTEDGGLVQRCLKALQPLSDGEAQIDTTVSNAARICRLPGTWNRKGEGDAERTHRRATILEVPEPVETVATQLLEELAAQVDMAASDVNYIPSTCLSNRPGDDFNQRGDVRPLLLASGWTLIKPGENEHWRRPGKESGNHSATLNQDGVFYVFSANATPFEPNKGYSPFAVYTLLGHAGDFESAARQLCLEGYGSDVTASDVDISGILATTLEEPQSPPADPGPPDPGPLPESLLHAPGFIAEVMEQSLETAPYPNLVMSFAGALSLQAFLAGRKVRDSGDNRTNLYLLGLAHSAAGKDWPRKLNLRIAHAVGLVNQIGERFASGEGIQDALFQTPSMLFQTDEIDGMLQSINKSKDARHEAIMTTLLTMYSSAASVYPMRRKAGKENPGSIDQPSLTIFGTAIPNHYYEALSERMLTNGFFARMLVLESGPRGKGQEPSIREIPPRILATAQWWADYSPGAGNLVDWHPVPTVVPHSDEALQLLAEVREEAESEYSAAEAKVDPVGTTVWGRVSEQVRKLALIYAISENHLTPRISVAAIRWAATLVMHQTRRMLFMAAGHVADGEFDALCLRAIRRIEKEPKAEIAHSTLANSIRLSKKQFTEVIETLEDRGKLRCFSKATKGRSGLWYKSIK